MWFEALAQSSVFYFEMARLIYRQLIYLDCSKTTPRLPKLALLPHALFTVCFEVSL